MAYNYRPLVLIILDGYGVNTKDPKNTWQYAKRDNFELLEKFYPFTVLQASGPAVGLPWGEEGNSEVGHLTIGAGRPVYTHLPRIVTAINDGSFWENPAFKNAVGHAKENNSRLHLMGLFSSGSVHSYPDHLYALLELAKRENVSRVYLHLFTDGRDSPQREGAKFFRSLEERLVQKYPGAQIASVVGRAFAMDRDGHWDSVEKAYSLLAAGSGEPFESASLFIEKAYGQNISDEFIEPGFLSEAGEAAGRIAEGDSVIFFNFREDSARELTGAFVAEGFDKFPRQKINNLTFVSMTRYDPSFPVEVAFPPIDIEAPIAKLLSDAGLKQLHVAETEKYAHVTYFFNGGREAPFPGEDRILVPSLATAHFDQAPEMSAGAITEKVLESLAKYDFILVNFANADVVGHTGSLEATVRALEVLDESLGRIISVALESGGALLITSDHGNAEEKLYQISGEKRTKHTSNPVPFFVVAKGFELSSARSEAEIIKNYREVRGTLTDVAPTILELMGLGKPSEMTGISLTKMFEGATPILTTPQAPPLRHAHRKKFVVASVLALLSLFAVAGGFYFYKTQLDNQDGVPVFSGNNLEKTISSNHVYILEDDGTIDQEDGLDPAVLSAVFYKKYPDIYDFIAVFPAFPPTKEFDTIANSWHVQNNVRGICQSLEKARDNAYWSLAESDNLKTMQMFAHKNNNYDELVKNPKEMVITLLHEIAHAWGVVLGNRASSIESGALLLVEGELPEGINKSCLNSKIPLAKKGESHWSKGLQMKEDAVDFIEEALPWRDEGGGIYTYDLDFYEKPGKFHPFDLYLMGFMDKSEIKEEFLLLNDTENYYTEDHLPNGRILKESEIAVKSTSVKVTIQDVIEIAGEERSPNARQSQKDFKQAFVILVKPGQAPPDNMLKTINKVAEIIPDRWAEATLNRSSMNKD